MSAPRPRRAQADLLPLGGVLDGFLSEMESRIEETRATREWTSVVGPDVARRTRAAGVRDGELVVEVQGAVWMGHLAVLRQSLMEALNERLPEGARIRSIRLVPMRFKEERIESE